MDDEFVKPKNTGFEAFYNEANTGGTHCRFHGWIPNTPCTKCEADNRKILEQNWDYCLTWDEDEFYTLHVYLNFRWVAMQRMPTWSTAYRVWNDIKDKPNV